jgi:hypothetical protein
MVEAGHPQMTEQSMAEIMAESRYLDTIDVAVSDL